jgi:hypothetical protein
MSSNWDRFDLLEGLPSFTQEEQDRIDRVFRSMQAKYDPIGARMRRYRDAAIKNSKNKRGGK